MNRSLYLLCDSRSGEDEGSSFSTAMKDLEGRGAEVGTRLRECDSRAIMAKERVKVMEKRYKDENIEKMIDLDMDMDMDMEVDIEREMEKEVGVLDQTVASNAPYAFRFEEDQEEVGKNNKTFDVGSGLVKVDQCFALNEKALANASALLMRRGEMLNQGKRSPQTNARLFREMQEIADRIAELQSLSSAYEKANGLMLQDLPVHLNTVFLDVTKSSRDLFDLDDKDFVGACDASLETTVHAAEKAQAFFKRERSLALRRVAARKRRAKKRLLKANGNK